MKRWDKVNRALVKAKGDHVAVGSASQHWLTLVLATNDIRGHTPDRPRRWLLRASKSVGIVAILLTCAGFVLNELPKLSVGSSDSPERNDPMAAVFYLSNDGKLPLYGVSFACALNNLGELTDNVVTDLGHLNAVSLRPGEKLAMSCPDAVQVDRTAATARATITLLVTYRPAWTPWNKHACFPMEARTNAWGEWVWKNLPQ
jgi:hypothetical protein